VLLNDLDAWHKPGDSNVVVAGQQQLAGQLHFGRFVAEIRQEATLLFDQERPEIKRDVKQVLNRKVFKSYLGNCVLFDSKYLIQIRNLLTKLCSLVEPGSEKSKSLANCSFIFWNTGSWTVA
jgi:hypothetical protein